MVALFHAGHAGPDIDDDARALVAEDGREEPFGVGAGERELVGVADAGGLDLDQHLAAPGPVEVDLHDLERLALLDGDGGAGFHGCASAYASGFPGGPNIMKRVDPYATGDARRSPGTTHIGCQCWELRVRRRI